MDGRCVDSYSFFSADIRSIFQVCVLPFLFCLEVQACDCDQKHGPKERGTLTSQATEILFNHCLVNGGSTTNTLAIVVSNASRKIDVNVAILRLA
jgi:hypothetical protein